MQITSISMDNGRYISRSVGEYSYDNGRYISRSVGEYSYWFSTVHVVMSYRFCWWFVYNSVVTEDLVTRDHG
jgi:hypothetical protein